MEQSIFNTIPHKIPVLREFQFLISSFNHLSGASVFVFAPQRNNNAASYIFSRFTCILNYLAPLPSSLIVGEASSASGSPVAAAAGAAIGGVVVVALVLVFVWHRGRRKRHAISAGLLSSLFW